LARYADLAKRSRQALRGGVLLSPAGANPVEFRACHVAKGFDVGPERLLGLRRELGKCVQRQSAGDFEPDQRFDCRAVILVARDRRTFPRARLTKLCRAGRLVVPF